MKGDSMKNIDPTPSINRLLVFKPKTTVAIEIVINTVDSKIILRIII